MPQTALITVTHDPYGRNIKLFQELQRTLEDLYSELFITISDQSSQELTTALEDSKFQTKQIPKSGAANARREAVKFGLTGHSPHFHYCDFDRLLTWIKHHKEELKNLLHTESPYHYVILGRTARAFAAHPIEWIETERITNKICSLELGKEVDITAGSALFSKEAAQLINTYSSEKMTDAEWAMIVHRIAKKEIGYQAVEGLEYQEELNSPNRKMSDSEAWLTRLKLSVLISETAIRTGK
ncbi:hypothetical protein FIU87_13160 [Bacillus sp. THAF10]|uniref:hypothetical protein n=1 Tax=Bacillus sp. THAF10 TaxID=2587848 RepID=UPI001268A735|nr:hypothetical protein [Bacillus sp. THAF10]QFT89603.1 hypothetical protein FIU87_13160 [Bacillus sp. THAF10]